LDSIRNKVDKGTEIDATDVAPILEHVSPETLRAVEEMVSLSNYTNRFIPKASDDPFSASNAINLGSRLLGGFMSYSTMGKGGAAMPAIRELLAVGKKSEMINANQLSKLEMAEKKAIRAADESVDSLKAASSLETAEDYARAIDARKELVARRGDDPEYARYSDLMEKETRSKAEESEVNRLYNKFSGISSEISRLNRAIGAESVFKESLDGKRVKVEDASVNEGITPEKQIEEATKAFESKSKEAANARKKLKAKLDDMSKADQLRYLKGLAIRNAEKLLTTGEGD
ncbi:MAG: hypothetical protein ACRCZ2_04170, partial [Fusobacteriaceae bacterium]